MFKLLRDFAVEKFFSYESLNARKEEKSSTNELPTRFAVEFFFVLRIAQSRKAKDFFADELHTRASTGKPRKPSSPPGLVYRHKKGTWRRKEKKKTKEGEKVAPAKARFRVPYTKNSFLLVHEYLGLEVARLGWSIGSCIFLRGSHVWRKFRKRTTLRSKSSTLKGLLYAPIQRKQYLKRTTLRRLKILLRSIHSKEGPHYCLSKAWARKLSSDKRQSTFIHELDILGDSILGLYCVAWPTQESVSSRIFVRKKSMSHVQSNGCSQQTLSTEGKKREKSTVVMLLPDSHKRLAFEKPTRSVPETLGRMYDVLALRN